MYAMKRQVLVTGASSGIGRAIARRALALGFQVIGCSRDASKFLQHHAAFRFFELDLADVKAIPGRIKILQATFPKIDTVVFAAGVGQFGSIEEFSVAQIEHIFNVNFTANVLLTKALLPRMKQAGGGHLIYIGSEAALKGSRKGAIYCASKFALRGFTQALREDCSGSKIRVSLINPGMVETPFFDELKFAPGADPGQSLSAADVADCAQYLLQSNTLINIDEINLNPLQKVVQFKK